LCIGVLEIVSLIEYYKIPIKGKKVVVIGRSTLVGKPTALAFTNLDATVTICHRETKNLKEHTKRANVLIVAVGKPKLITRDHVSRGQIVIDVGINRTAGGKIVGDVDFENVKEVASYITPVPGGVGPMTVACLIENLTQSLVRGLSYKSK